jgi:hypothetical protein
VIGIAAIYAGYHSMWGVLALTLATTPLCSAVRLLMMSGKALEVDDVQSRFFEGVLAARGHSLTNK